MEQPIIIPILLLVLGFILIIKGGDWFVDAVIWISEVTHIPKMLIGATIVSLCTTLPELLVSTIAVSSGSPDLGIGNALGSMVCNTGLILGISMTFLPAAIHRKTFIAKSLFLLAAIILFGIFGWNLNINWIEGLILAAVMGLFIFYNVRQAMSARQMNEDEPVVVDKKTVSRNMVKFLVGVFGIIAGARLLVDNGQILARAAGVSDQIIGLTVIALGTSLPELVTTISAVVKKEFSLSVGNVLGANILNILLIISTCSIISPTGLPINLQEGFALFKGPIAQSLVVDLPVVLFVTLLVVVPGAITGRLKRWQGITLLSCYVLYIGFLALSNII